MTGPSGRSPAPKPWAPGSRTREPPVAAEGALADGLGELLRRVGVAGFLPGGSGPCERIGDEKVAVGRIVAVGDARLAAGIPLPDCQAIVADEKFGEGEVPDLLEGSAVLSRQREEQPVSLSLAVADVAVGIVHDPPVVLDETGAIGLPVGRRDGADDVQRLDGEGFGRRPSSREQENAARSQGRSALERSASDRHDRRPRRLRSR